jgi:hypothetical protein
VTIELNSVFSITIPNKVFVQPQVSVSNDGSIFTNKSFEQVRIGSVPGAEGATFILGRFYFSSVCLSVDYDAGTYTLWPAKATGDTDLVAFGGNCSSPPVNAGTDHNSTGGDSDHTGKQGPSDTGGISTGAIAGIAVGCAVFAAVVGAIAVLWFVRRRKRSKDTMKEGTSNETDPHAEGTMRDSYCGPRFYEAMSNHIQELGAEHEPGEMHAVTAPQELSTEKADRERQRRMLQGMNSPVELS